MKKIIFKIYGLVIGLFLLGSGVFAQNMTTTVSSVDSGVVFYGTAGVVNKQLNFNNGNSNEIDAFRESKGMDSVPVTYNDLLECEGQALIEHAHDIHFYLDPCKVDDACPFKTLDVLTLDQKGVTINTQYVSPTCAWVGSTTINGRTFLNGATYINGSQRIIGGQSVVGNADFYGDLIVYDNAGNEIIKANSSNGTFFAHDIIVQAAYFPDYVFSPDYVLPSILEFRKVVENERHLPCLSPATLYESQGLSIYQFNKQLVEQVEILALYLLQQEKEIVVMKGLLNELSK
jgi:hypothetical protein